MEAMEVKVGKTRRRRQFLLGLRGVPISGGVSVEDAQWRFLLDRARRVEHDEQAEMGAAAYDEPRVARWSRENVMMALNPYLDRKFSVLRFVPQPPSRKVKSAYILVAYASGLSKAKTLESIIRVTYKGVIMHGYIPDPLPEVLSWKGNPNAAPLPKAKYPPAVPKDGQEDVGKGPTKSFSKLDIENALLVTLKELVFELQYKYHCLYKLSHRMRHKLLNRVSRTISDRLVLAVHSTIRPSGFTYSKTYRALHPHDSDFDMVMECLHRIEDSLGQEHTVANEANWLRFTFYPPPDIPEFSYSKFHTQWDKQLKNITNKVKEHLDGLELGVPQKTEELQATVTVRKNLKKQIPLIDFIMRSSVPLNDVLPPEYTTRPIPLRVYGVPFLPVRDVFDKFFQRFDVKNVSRLQSIYNCVTMEVPYHNYSKLARLNGIKLGICKVLIRPARKRQIYYADQHIVSIQQGENDLHDETYDASDYEILGSDMEAELNDIY